MKFLRILFLSLLLAPLLSFAAAVSPASITVYPGNATPSVKYYFNNAAWAETLSQGVNNRLEMTVMASHEQDGFAVRFSTVQAFDKNGVPLGENIASETNALLTSPRNFVFDDFPLSDEELNKAAGVAIAFFPVGGKSIPSDRVTIANVAFSLKRQTGESCVIVDPFTVTVPTVPLPTVQAMQRERPLVQPGTHGTGGVGRWSGYTGTE